MVPAALQQGKAYPWTMIAPALALLLLTAAPQDTKERIKSDVKEAGREIGKAGQKVGHAFKEGGKKVGKAAKPAAQAVGKGAKKAGKGIAEGAKEAAKGVKAAVK